MSLSDNLISYWSLGEASGNAIDDHSTNDLTDTNTVGTATGKVGNCRDFEANNGEYLTRADNAALSIGDIDMTLTCWINMESQAGDDGIVAGKHDANISSIEYSLYYNLTTDRLVFRVSSDGATAVEVTASTFGAVPTATWMFVVCRHDATANQISISVNAGTANTTAHSGGIFNGTAPFRLGADAIPGTYFDGLIDEVGLWKRALTNDEVTELYNSGSGRDYAYITSGPAFDPATLPFPQLSHPAAPRYKVTAY